MVIQLVLSIMLLLSILVAAYGMLCAAAEKSRSCRRVARAYEMERIAAADLHKVASIEAMRRRYGRRV